jgi:hypothetical protein
MTKHERKFRIAPRWTGFSAMIKNAVGASTHNQHQAIDRILDRANQEHARVLLRVRHS